MSYQKIKTVEFFKKIDTEDKAIRLLWRSRFSEKDFVCANCKCEEYYEIRTRPEVRTCKQCLKQVRLRAATIFENSKLPLLVWVRAIFLVMQGKRGISALELKRQLEMKSYGTTWLMLQKIRRALQQRDEPYKLKNIIELDGALFGKRQTGNQAGVLVAVETKDFIDEKGRPKSRAGFAKVMVAKESTKDAEKFVEKNIEHGSMVNVDASLSLREFKNVDVDYRQMNGDHEELNRWLPWVHRFISNAKAWVIGTHHGVEAKYLGAYLAEYTYRFNRRHDPDSLFYRALKACITAVPVTQCVLSG